MGDYLLLGFAQGDIEHAIVLTHEEIARINGQIDHAIAALDGDIPATERMALHLRILERRASLAMENTRLRAQLLYQAHQ